MQSRIQNLSVQGKITWILVTANLFIFITILLLFGGINQISDRIDAVYRENLKLNELSSALLGVQDSMEAYLSARTSDSLEEFFRNEQIFSTMIQEQEQQVTGTAFGYMEKSIYAMSGTYVELVDQTIEAKRGRNVEKYRIRYENATQVYDYIQSHIESLNQKRFEENSKTYSVVLERFRTFETAGSWLMTFVLVGNIFIIVKLIGTIISPLKQLAGYADQVSAGNFDIEITPTESKDEIGVVTRAFQKMVVSIRQYIEKLRQSMEVEQELKEKELLMETHLKDAKLKYLQAQINPHFLFNTLNAAAQLSMLEEADRTYDYLQNVANFFRYNVKNADEIVTLGQELDLIDYYIYILNVRFSGDIHYEKHADEKYLMLNMPGMILQPIVENCVRHGIHEMEGDGKIWLTVGEKDGRVYVSIRDNGVGMSQDVIQKVLDGEWRPDDNVKNSNGVGMDNVIARLRLYQKRDDVMEIHSAGENLGTEFIVYVQ